MQPRQGFTAERDADGSGCSVRHAGYLSCISFAVIV